VHNGLRYTVWHRLLHRVIAETGGQASCAKPKFPCEPPRFLADNSFGAKAIDGPPCSLYPCVANLLS